MNKNNNLVVYLLFTFLLITLTPGVFAFSGGDGSVGDPYQITNCNELQAMNSNLAANYVLANDIDCSDTVNWNSGAGFLPIGTGYRFTGTFDGQSFKITGLFVNLPSQKTVGLFSVITASAKIKNVGLLDVKITGIGTVGGLVGSNSGTITNSYSTGSVNGGSSIGGLVGSNSDTITNSYSTGSVNGGSGYNFGGLAGSNYGTITDSYSTGSVNGGNNMGGLVGVNGNTIINSYWDIDTSGQATSAGGTGKTTAEMKTKSTFVDWDFTDIWQMCNEINNGYPSLKSFGECSCIPTPEIWDGLDNDCDDIADEGYEYTWAGFFQPVDNLPTLNKVNSGRAIPLKFSLNRDMGLNIFTAGYPLSQKMACDSSSPLDNIETTVTAGGSSLTYNPVTKQYNYVWKTDKAWSNSCRQLVVKLSDGTTHTANFKFTK